MQETGVNWSKLNRDQKVQTLIATPIVAGITIGYCLFSIMFNFLQSQTKPSLDCQFFMKYDQLYHLKTALLVTVYHNIRFLCSSWPRELRKSRLIP